MHAIDCNAIMSILLALALWAHENFSRGRVGTDVREAVPSQELRDSSKSSLHKEQSRASA